jgi:tetratricopeptide (TPR) repeat protein
MMRPGDPQTIRNLGSVHAFMGDYLTAAKVIQDGLKLAPGDTTLTEALRSVRVNYANQLADQKKYDEAIDYFKQLTVEEPKNPDHWLSLADVTFRKAQTLEGDARKPLFSSAGECYEKAFGLKSSDPDLAFNAALSRQNAGEWEKSEADWRAVLKLRADDVDAMSSLGAVLAELKKYDDGIKILHQAVLQQPENKNLHRQLGAVYTKAENNPKATEELMVYLAMQNGKPEPDAAATAKAARDGSAAAKTVAAEGPPDQLNRWEADQQKYETWFYFKKHQAFTFSDGTLVTRSDWSAPVLKGAAGSSAPKKK